MARPTDYYKRCEECRRKVKKSWTQVCKEAKISMKSWMTGVPTSNPSDDELRKLAPVLETTYEYLKFGIKETEQTPTKSEQTNESTKSESN